MLRQRRSLPGLGSLLLVPTLAVAQQAATVSGRAVDNADGSPVALASVVVMEAESGTRLSGTLSGNDGRFVLQGLAPGRYIVRVAFPGFSPSDVAVLVSRLNPSYDLGEIRLGRIVTVEEIRVTADAIRSAGLNTEVFRLDAGAAPSTGSLLDALKNLPGVVIDPDGRVLLRGSDQVAILIDGRQSSLTGFGSQRGLDNVPAANVEAIEIIHNPSARFDAAGMAGIINIIYKRERERGVSAEAGLSMGVGQLTKQRADLPTELGSFSVNEKITPSLNLNYTTDRIRTFLQGEILFQHDLPNNEFTTRRYDDGRVIESQVPENREQRHHIVRAGADWFYDDANTVTLSAIHDLEHHTDRAQVPFIDAATGARQRFWFWTEEESTGFANASVTWNHRFPTPGHELDVNLQYTRGWEDEAYSLNEVSPVRSGRDMTHLEAKENTLPLSVDYTRPLASGRLELGGKLQRRWLPISYLVERGVQSVIYPGLGDFSDWSEDIAAVYANLVRVTEGYTLEAGLRLEQTDVAYTIPDENIYYEGSDAYDYFEAFPNVKLSVALGGSYRLNAAYNRRIDRPGEPELRIFPKYDDPELLKVGNPFLRPQLTNVFELGLTRAWGGGSARAAAYHRAISGAFLRIYAIDSSNASYDVVNKIFTNVGSSRQTGLEVIVEQQMVDAWRVGASFNWFRNDIDALQTTVRFPTARPFAIPASDDDTWELTLTNRIQLPRAGEVQLSYVHYAARNIPQGRQRARSSLDFAGSLPIRRDRAELVFTFTDILNDFAVRQDIEGRGFDALYENLLETQVATVGVKVRW